MGLDVDIPDPPSLDDPQDPGDYDAVEETDYVGDDYRREELSGFLESSAWEAGFAEWADYTSLTTEKWELVTALELVSELDFYWNPAEEDVGYRAPELGDNEDLPAPFDDRFGAADVAEIEAELDSLARAVTEVLEAEYLGAGEEGDYGFYDDGS